MAPLIITLRNVSSGRLTNGVQYNIDWVACYLATVFEEDIGPGDICPWTTKERLTSLRDANCCAGRSIDCLAGSLAQEHWCRKLLVQVLVNSNTENH
jgi:hypothetical protein